MKVQVQIFSEKGDKLLSFDVVDTLPNVDPCDSEAHLAAVVKDTCEAFLEIE